MLFSNSLFTGGDDTCLLIGWVDELQITNSTFSSENSDGIVRFIGGVTSDDVSFTNCGWEGTGTAPPIAALNGSTIKLSVISPAWNGSSEFISFNAVANEQLTLSVLGGTVGTSTTPIILEDYKNTEKNVQVFGFNQGVIQSFVYVGTLDGSGNAAIAHGIVSAQNKVLSVGAWYKGGFGEMQPLTTSTIDGDNIAVTGGSASANYRVTLFYSNSDDPAW